MKVNNCFIIWTNNLTRILVLQVLVGYNNGYEQVDNSGKYIYDTSVKPSLLLKPGKSVLMAILDIYTFCLLWSLT